jgi:amino acid adenylation domain-containing protein/non-ribosomal peptide synthase protein (TIGR01720 family)
MVVALLAVLKAGGVYVPLDADFPADRLRFMVAQTGAELVLTAGPTTGRVPAGDWRTVDIGSLDLPHDTSAPPPVAGPDNGCYVIFTSGSTGRPKGVVTLHRNVTELLHGGEVMALRADDTVLQIATVAFDVATFEIWAPLAAGARLVLAPPGRYSLADVAGWVAGHGVTVLHATASLFALLVEEEPQLFDGLRRLLTGSETVSPRHVERILERCPGLEVVNCWGPTETTTFSVCGVYVHGTVPAGPLPLGTPLANTEVWVLDDAGLPVPVGTPGELYVAGPCLARGYLNDPALTADRFRPHPDGGRLYRTGDRGFWSVDGRVEFLGRVDHMVKIRGFRVELGEIEAALDAHPALRDRVVVAHHDDSGHAALAAYVVPDDGLSPDDLRVWLRERLPEHMVPGHLVFLTALPLTAQGKVDRRALPAPGEERTEPEREYAAPQNPIEERLAAIWSQVLEVDQVGVADDFQALGGDSILALQIVGRARRAGLHVTAADMLAGRTIAQLAESVGAEEHETAGSGSAEPSGAPLTPIQRWFLDLTEPDPDHTDQFVLLEMARPVDADRLGKTVLALLDTHVMLRSRLVGDGRFEVCSVPESAPIEQIDLSGVAPGLHREHTQRIAWEAARDWRLDRSPQMRFFLIVRGHGRLSWILIVTHHLVVDGVSWQVLLGDLVAMAAGSPIPPVPTGYPAFAEIVAQYASSPRALAQMPYWRAVHDAMDTRLPVELRAGPGDQLSETVISTRLDPAATAALLSRTGGHELLPSLLSALACALAGWVPDGELAVMLLRHGRTLAHRPQVDLSRTVGWCSVRHPLALPVRAGASPAKIAARMAERLAEVPDEGLGFGALRWHGGHFPDVPAPDVAFNYVGQDRAGTTLRDVAEVVQPGLIPERAPGARRAHPLWIQAAVIDDELMVHWQFSVDRNLPESVAAAADRFLETLRLLGSGREETP